MGISLPQDEAEHNTNHHTCASSMRMRLLWSWTSHSGCSHLAPVSTAAVTGVGWMKPYRDPPFAKLLLSWIAKVTPGCEMALPGFSLEVKLKLHSGAGNTSGTSTMGRYKRGLILWRHNSLQ